MNCDDARTRHLSGDNPDQTAAHIAGCPACRRVLDDLDQIKRRLADNHLWESPSPDLGERLVDTIAAAAEPPSTTATSPSRRWPRVLGMIGAAAAVAVIAAAATLIVTRSDDPDWEFSLKATDDAPSADATIAGWNKDSGTRLELVVNGLAATGDDEYYALWLTAPDGRHLPAATFNESGTVIGWVAASRRDFPRVWVTLEPSDDNEALSGVTVLDTAEYEEAYEEP